MTGRGFDLFDEIRAVSAEALRLARDGGTVDERAAHFERKARVMAELEAMQCATDRAKQAPQDLPAPMWATEWDQFRETVRWSRPTLLPRSATGDQLARASGGQGSVGLTKLTN